MSHTCHARGCLVEVKPELLMCKDHWSMVPRSLQRAVWRHYRAGQCDDKRPSEAWMKAATAAIGWVALKTGEKLNNAEVCELVRIGYRLTVVREYMRRTKLDQPIIEEAIDKILADGGVPRTPRDWRERHTIR